MDHKISTLCGKTWNHYQGLDDDLGRDIETETVQTELDDTSQHEQSI